MAQVDVQWPSEDEDFDATFDETAAETGTSEKSTKPGKSVAIIDGDQPEESEPADKSDELGEADAPDQAEADPEPDKSGHQMAAAETSAGHSATEHGPPQATQAAESQSATSPEETPNEAAGPEPLTDPISSAPLAPARLPQTSNSSLRLVPIIVLSVALIAFAAWVAVLHSHNTKLKQQNTQLQADKTNLTHQVAQLKSNPQIAIQKQTQDLVNQVGKLIDLPKGEVPTIANVSDVTAARKQSAFFNNAQNNDKVLMYVKAGQAILYRPSTNKIILVAPLTFSGK